MVSTAECIAIAEFVVFVPVLISMIFVLIRHGFNKQLGWLHLATFSIIRIVGASFEIAAAKNPGNKSDLVWATILQSIGIGALILSSLGLLRRVIDQTSTHVRGPRNPNFYAVISSLGLLRRVFDFVDKKGDATSRRSRVIQWVQIPTLAIVILAVVGGVNESSDSASDQKRGRSMLKAALVLFTVIYAVLFVLTAKSASEFRTVPAGEKRILAVIMAALPLIAVRILWSLLAVFVNDGAFRLLGGNVTVRIIMATAEEFIVVIAYTILGLVTPKSSDKASNLEAQQVPVPQRSLPQHSLNQHPQPRY